MVSFLEYTTLTFCLTLGVQSNAPPPLSAEEQQEKNQAAIEVLRQWREEDKTDDTEVIP